MINWKSNEWKRMVWWMVFVLGLGGAYAFGQMNARWYREPITKLDYTTSIDVVGDALERRCFAVMVFRNRMSEQVDAAVSLGQVACGKDGGSR